MNVEQKYLPSYFNNLKRSRVEDLDSKEEKIVKLKRDKNFVKLGENTNYTIQNFFKFSKDEDSIKKLKNDIKSLRLISTHNNKDLKNPNSIQNYFKKENKTEHNIFNINLENSNKVKNVFYEDMRITNFIKIDSGFDFNGLNENLFFNVIKYINFKDLTKCSLISKSLKKFYEKIINSYYYFKHINNTNHLEFSKLLFKTKKLKHSKFLLDMIRNDFGGNILSMSNRILLKVGLTEKGDIIKNGALFESFSIQPLSKHRLSSQDNFFSNNSLDLLCRSSRFSLKGLALTSCIKLNNSISNYLCNCNFLVKLEISYNNSIQDEAIEKITNSCQDLKMICIPGLSSITEKSIISISKLKHLESLNVSQCNLIKCDYLTYLKNSKLKIFYGNDINITDSDLQFVIYLVNLNNLSISGVNISDKAIDVLINCSKLKELNLMNNQRLTEKKLYELIDSLNRLDNLYHESKNVIYYLNRNKVIY